MKRYIVDVRNLSPEEKAVARKRLEGFAFIISDMFDGNQGLIGLEVFWDSIEDFFSSPVYPSNCHCFEA